MYKKIVSSFLMAAMLVGASAPLTHAAGVDPNMNKPEYWAGKLAEKNYTNVACVKLNKQSVSFTTDKDYALVVIKAGTVSETWYDTASGTVLKPSSGKTISHVITCSGTAPVLPPTVSNRFVQKVICGAPDDVYLPAQYLTLGARYVDSTNLDFSTAYTFGFTMLSSSEPASVTYTYPDENGQIQTATETFVDDNAACETTL